MPATPATGVQREDNRNPLDRKVLQKTPVLAMAQARTCLSPSSTVSGDFFSDDVVLERRMKFPNLQCEWARVIRGLEALQQVEATFQDKRFVLRSQLTREASAALRATGVAAPPTLR
jgi:hypothetical protein